MIMTNEIEKHWIVHPLPADRPISIRALKPKGCRLKLPPENRTYYPTDYATEFARKKAFEHDALRFNQAGYNVYCIMNQIRSDLEYGRAVADKDITHRSTLLVDIDRMGDTSAPATEIEVDAAFELAEDVEGFLKGEGFPEAIWVHSGNGVHLYYTLPLVPESENTCDTVETFLNGLAAKFNTSLVGIDTVVFNAARITKVVGTVARKGLESPGRPYRMARLYEK